ncbi:MAG: DUF111 family protein, partial [Proteobacteria bacterium]|nr:DUF111 family protein [Pseudomonadota bacterium]
MEFDEYTERSRGLIQAAQGLALRAGHQQITPEHLLKALLDDGEGLAAKLIEAAGGDPARALDAVEAALAKLPKVEGSGAGRAYMGGDLARLLEQAEKLAKAAGDRFVTAERLLLALAMAGAAPAAKALAEDAFHRLAVAEGVVHDQSPEQVTFHEVGALDSILDVCLSAALFDRLNVDHLRCSPLPVCDGTVKSAHGILATPAPA